MPRTRSPYPAEFREQMIALVRAGRSPEELAKEFEPSLKDDERDELRRLRKENKQLRLERDILSKAAA